VPATAGADFGKAHDYDKKGVSIYRLHCSWCNDFNHIGLRN